MCGLVSFLSLHPSNTASCLQEWPTPSASEAHISCLEAGKQIPFYLPCKSTDVWNVSKCTQPSRGFRHSFSLDDLFGILILSAFRAEECSFCSFRAASASLFQPMCHGQQICVATSALSQLPSPFARQILIGIWKILYQMHGLYLDSTHISPLSSEEGKWHYKWLGCRRPDVTLSSCVILGLLLGPHLPHLWNGVIETDHLEAFLSLRFYDFKPLDY